MIAFKYDTYPGIDEAFVRGLAARFLGGADDAIATDAELEEFERQARAICAENMNVPLAEVTDTDVIAGAMFAERMEGAGGYSRPATIDELRQLHGDGADLVADLTREFGGELPETVADTLRDAGYSVGGSA